jgi:hypothetical protein
MKTVNGSFALKNNNTALGLGAEEQGNDDEGVGSSGLVECAQGAVGCI